MAFFRPLRRKRRIRARVWLPAVLLALTLIFHHAILQRVIEATAGMETGTHVAADSSRIGLNGATFFGVSVRSTSDEPIARIERLDVTYDLSQVGDSRRIAGIQSIDVIRPAVTVLRRADGTYNLPIPSSSAGPSRAFALILNGTVVDGTVSIADERANHGAPLRFEHVNAAFDIDTSAHTHYTASLAFLDASRPYPIRGAGSADAARHTMLQHWEAAQIPVARIATFAADDPRLRVDAGTLQAIDAIYAGFPQTDGAMDAHLAATARLAGGKLTIEGLTAPVRDASGRFDLTGSGVTTDALSASVAGTRVRLSGGIFDFSHPTLRIAASGRADLSRVHALIANPALKALRGTIAFSGLAIGSASDPTVLAAVRAGRSSYGVTPIDRAEALAAIDARGADLLAFRAASGSSTLFSAGRVAFTKDAGATGMLIHLQTRSSTFGDAQALLPGMTLTADALANSNDPAKLRLAGIVFGQSASQRVLGAFATNARGAGSFGPMHLDDGPGSLYARGRFDASHGSFTALAAAHRFQRVDGALLVSFDGTQGSVAARGTAGGGRFAAYGTLGRNGAVNVAANGVDVGTMHTNGATIHGGTISFGATIAGTLHSPHATGAFAVGHGSFDGQAIDGSAAFSANSATVRVSDALASFGSALVDLDGNILHASSSPAYDVGMRVHGADLHDLARIADPSVASIVDGSADADVRIAGTGAAASASGTFDAPEGSVNGLAFRSLSGTFAGTPGSVAVRGGSVSIGSTDIAFSGGATSGRETISLQAPSVDLADFNDFFDRGDALAGRGRLNVSADAQGERIVASSGFASFSNARVLRFPLGNAGARWSTSQENLAMHLALAEPSGRAGIDGSVQLSNYAMNLRGYARGADIAQWLAVTGVAVPVAITGRADGDISARGRYPRLFVSASGHLRDGTANGIAIQQAAFAGHVDDGRGTIDSAAIRIPYLGATANGTFGLRADAPLHLSVHAVSSDAGKLAQTIAGKPYDAAGAVDTTLAIEGTAAHPLLSDNITVEGARYGRLSFPHASASLTADEHHAAIRQSEVDFQKGRLKASAAFPIQRNAGAFSLGRGPVAANVRFDDVELSNFAAMLPKGSTLSGRIDGSANAAGTSAAPELSGTIALANGALSAPQITTPITSIGATVTAHGSTIDLVSLHAKAGTGTLDASGRASAPSLLELRDGTVALNAAAHGAQVDLPAYFKGQVDGTLALARAPGSIPSLHGDVSVSHARLPVSAFLQASGASGGKKPPNVALDLHLHAGTDVRVQSPNVDVGGTGTIRVAGTLDSPSAAGRIDATGGSIDFYRNFRLESGRVSFSPDDGLIPDVHAVATTYIADPQTDVTISVTGQATNMQLGLASDPNYDRAQILALLAGANSTSPFSATGQAENLAFGQANQMFTRELLDPLSANLGSALGLANLDLYNDLGEGFGFSAKQKLGEHLTATGSESFGAQRRQDMELAYHKSDATALQLHIYQQQPILFSPATQASVGNVVFNMTSATIPPIDGGGTSGISLSLQRRYW